MIPLQLAVSHPMTAQIGSARAKIVAAERCLCAAAFRAAGRGREATISDRDNPPFRKKRNKINNLSRSPFFNHDC
ncbi:MAG: hypothetical protein ABTQ31_13375 [Rhizobiaceae bacterium]